MVFHSAGLTELPAFAEIGFFMTVVSSEMGRMEQSRNITLDYYVIILSMVLFMLATHGFVGFLATSQMTVNWPTL